MDRSPLTARSRVDLEQLKVVQERRSGGRTAWRPAGPPPTDRYRFVEDLHLLPAARDKRADEVGCARPLKNGRLLLLRDTNGSPPIEREA